MCLRVVLVVAVVGVGSVAMTPLNLTVSSQWPVLRDKPCPSWIKPPCPCPSRHSCRHRNDAFYSNNLDSCYCDHLCNTYADCCYDSEFRDASQQIIDDARDFRCDSIGGAQVYVRIGCQEGWTDAEVEDLCVGGGVTTDPVSGLPVTSTDTGYTYSNYYCAICNEDILGLRIWNVMIFSWRLSPLVPFDVSDLVFRNNRWGVFWPGPSDFITVSLAPRIPQDIRNLTRSCSLSTNTCSEDWQDEATAFLCQSYTAVVYPDSGYLSYRNPHCALCNKQRGIYSCFHEITGPSVGLEAFSVIFDITDPSGGNLVGSSSPCNATQVWDPFFKRCRSIVCPKPNQGYRHGRCVALREPNTMEGSEPTPAPTTTTATDKIRFSSYLDTLQVPTTRLLTKQNATTPRQTWRFRTTDRMQDLFTWTARSTTRSPWWVTVTERLATIADDNKSNSSNVTNNNSDPSNSNNNNTTNNLPPPNLFPRQDPSEISTQSPAVPSSDAATHTSPPPRATPATDAALSTNASSEFAECYKVILLEGEFVDLQNGTLYVAAYERTYSPGEYARVREGMLVCQPDTTSPSRKFSAELGWVSLAGLGLSCTSLLLHLAAFSLLPELRNLPGRNLASLCLALLAAYITFLVNMLVRPDLAGCVTLAVAMYYFFVTSFTWMNVIAFDVWYTFRLTQRQLRVSSGDQWHRFIAYSLYGWLLPAAATMVLLLIDQLEPRGVPQEFLPRLGRTWCWFSHRKSLLAFFAAPMVIIIVVNCVFFVSTSVIITQTSSTAAAVSARGSHPQGQYKLYLRLAVLMGFTWVSGIAAGYLNLEALWYVFVVLNTLQGVFIFLAFTFRTRVWHGVGATCRKLLQRGLSKMTRRPSLQDIRAFEMSHTPEATSASYSSPNTSLETC